MDEITIFNRNVSECEIRSIMWKDHGPSKDLCDAGSESEQGIPRPIGYYNFNMLGMNVSDASLYENDGNVINGISSWHDPEMNANPNFVNTTAPFIAPCLRRGIFKSECPPTNRTHDQEPAPHPNRCPAAFEDVVPSLVPIDGFDDVRLKGAGFAESPYLSCFVYQESQLVEFPAERLSDREVQCNLTGIVVRPGYYSLGVSNSYSSSSSSAPTNPSSNCSTHNTIELSQSKLQFSEMALYFDGEDDLVKVEDLPDTAFTDNNAVLLGAWFYPMSNTSCKEQPILCFQAPCSSSAVEFELCATYFENAVYVDSDLLEATSLSSGLTIAPFSSPFALEAELNQWHYLELRIVQESSSTDTGGNQDQASYLVEMVVDGIELKEESQLRWSGPASSSRMLAIGGATCVSDSSLTPSSILQGLLDGKRRRSLLQTGCSPSSARFFQGYIDEVRVTGGQSGEVDWFNRAQPVDSGVAYYRFNPGSGQSMNMYSFVPSLANCLSNLCLTNSSLCTECYVSSSWPIDLQGRLLNAAKTSTSDVPKFEYIAAPWEPSTVFSSTFDSLLDGGAVQALGVNFALSNWTKCTLTLADVSKGAGDDGDGDDEEDKAAVALQGKEISTPAGPISAPLYACPAEQSCLFMSRRTGLSTTKRTCTVPPADLPHVAKLRVKNAPVPQDLEASNSTSIIYREQFLRLDGDIAQSSTLIGRSAIEDEVLILNCGQGHYRIDNIPFAVFGNPPLCTPLLSGNCSGHTTINPCTNIASIVDSVPSCNADDIHLPDSDFTRSFILGNCYGQSSCSIPVSKEVFGSPCPSAGPLNLTVIATCSDRYLAKDFVRADSRACFGSSQAPGASEYSVALWVRLGHKTTRQAIFSFLGSHPYFHRAMLQWNPTRGKFVYYDDAVMNIETTGVYEAGIWYYVMVSVDKENHGTIAVDGQVAAHFITHLRPDASNSSAFYLGVTLDDTLQPGEWLQGDIDEVRVLTKALSVDDAKGLMQFAPPCTDCCIYLRFNDDNYESSTLVTNMALGHDDDDDDTTNIQLSSSSSNQWPSVEQVFENGIQISDIDFPGQDAVHPEAVIDGVPWFPIVLSDIQPSSHPYIYHDTYTLRGAPFEISGVNFAPNATISADLGLPNRRIGDMTFSLNATGDRSVDGLESYLVQEKGLFDEVVFEHSLSYHVSASPDDFSDTCYVSYFDKGLFADGDIINDNIEFVADRHGRINSAARFIGGEELLLGHSCNSSGSYSIAAWLQFDNGDDEQVAAANASSNGCLPEPAAANLGSLLMHIDKTYVGGPIHVTLVKSHSANTSYHHTFVNGHLLQTCEAITHGPGTHVCNQYIQILREMIEDKVMGRSMSAGVIDDVLIWERALSAQQIEEFHSIRAWSMKMDDGYILLRDRLGSAGVVVAEPTGPQGLLAIYSCGIGSCNNSFAMDLARNLSLSWGAEAPPGLEDVTSTDEWTARLRGWFNPPADDTYTLSVSSESGQYTLDLGMGVLNFDHNSGAGSAALSKDSWYLYDFFFRSVMGPANYSVHISSNDPLSIEQGAPLSSYFRAEAHGFGVSMWIKPETVQGNIALARQAWQPSFGNETDQYPETLASIVLHDGRLAVAVHCPCQDEHGSSTCKDERILVGVNSGIEANTWTYISIGYSGDEILIYKNCELTDAIEFETLCFPYVPQEFKSSYTWELFSYNSSFTSANGDNIASLVGGADAAHKVRGFEPFKGQVRSFSISNNASAPAAWECDCLVKTPSLEDSAFFDLSLGPNLLESYPQVDDGGYRLGGMYYDVLFAYSHYENATCYAMPSVPEYSQVKITVVGENMTAGSEEFIFVTTRDQCGGARHDGGDSVMLSAMGPLELTTKTQVVHAIDQADGSYALHLPMTIVGSYVVLVTVNSVEVANYHLTVVNGTVDYSMTRIVADQFSSLVAGIPSELLIQTFDSHENAIDSGGLTDWSIVFSGPWDYQLGDSVEDLGDGSYRLRYILPIAGHYSVSIELCGVSICTGGLAQAPAQLSSGCTFCVDVAPGYSLHTHPGGVYGSVPSSPSLELTGEMSLHSWIRLDVEPDDENDDESPLASPKQYASLPSKMDIIAKQSPISSKGSWLSLRNSTRFPFYTLEAGVYIGDESFRILRSSDLAISSSSWQHLAVTYDGSNMSLFYNGDVVATSIFGDGHIKFGRRNTQPLTIGQDFPGLIDEVSIYNAVVEPTAQSRMCPSESVPSLVANYRLNEGLSPIMLDSSPNHNHGVIGLRCSVVHAKEVLRLSCPEGYAVGETLFANYGHNRGACGEFIADCGASNASAYIMDFCRGMQSCRIRFDNPEMLSPQGRSLGPGCGHSSTLAVEAVCVPTADSVVLNPKSTIIAPSSVGVAADAQLSCAFNSTFNEDNDDCAIGAYDDEYGFELGGNMTAGVAQAFELLAYDLCGYRVFHDDDDEDKSTFQLSLSYLDTEFEVKAEPGCQSNIAPAAFVTSTEIAGESFSECITGSHNTTLITIPSKVGEAVMELKLNSESLSSWPVLVHPGAMSPPASKVVGSNVTEAGLWQKYYIVPYDVSGNPTTTDLAHHDIKIVLDGVELNVTSHDDYDDEENTTTASSYLSYKLQFPTPGTSELVFSSGGEVIDTLTITVLAPLPRALAQFNRPEAPAAAGRMSSAIVGPIVNPWTGEHELRVWGGVDAGRRYIEDTLSFSVPNRTATWTYRSAFALNASSSMDQVVLLEVDTSALISQGRLRSDCGDIRFQTANGTSLSYWMDPRPGCSAEATLFMVSIPPLTSAFEMYSGNSQAVSMSTTDIFDYFQGFEDETHMVTTMTQCSADAFVVDGDNPLSGQWSYKAVWNAMGATLIDIGDPFSPLNDTGYMVQFDLFDSGCQGSCFLALSSTESCSEVELPIPTQDFNYSQLHAFGVFEGASAKYYSSASPWRGSQTPRQAGWHRFQYESLTQTLTIDQQVARVFHPTEMSVESLVIYCDSAGQPGPGNGTFYWDNILIMKRGTSDAPISVSPPSSALSSSPSTVSSSDQSLHSHPGFSWQTWSSVKQPPARHSHSWVYDPELRLGFLFGGERSGYSFNDLWMYNVSNDDNSATWEFSLSTTPGPAGRHMHTAVLFEGSMYVYGGRSAHGDLLSDFWAFDVDQSSWKELDVPAGLLPRFGHSAVIADGKMLVFGGYIRASNLSTHLTNELWEYDFQTSLWARIGLSTLPSSPPARYLHSAITLGNMLFVCGGAGEHEEEVESVWKYDLAQRAWSEVESDHPSFGEMFGRAGATIAAYDQGFVLVYGGERSGVLQSGIMAYWLGTHLPADADSLPPGS